MPLNYVYSQFRAFKIAAELKKAGLNGKGANLPVLYMPGILGTKLYDRQERINVWGDPAGLLAHKPEHAAFKLDPCPCIKDLPASKLDNPRIIASEALHAFPIIPGLVHTLVTAELVHVLQAALGYRLGRDLVFIGHDWRQDYRLLAKRLDLELARIDAIYGSNQKIVLMGQSSGNFAFCHWLGKAKPSLRKRIARWYLFGPPWQGTYHSLSMLHEGYYPGTRYFHGFSPADVATYPSVYQMLRHNPKLIDHTGRAIEDLDLLSPDCWQEYGLGPWHQAQQKEHLSDDDKKAGLTPCLEMASIFADELVKSREAVKDISQLWFLGSANTAVRYAVCRNKKLLLKAKDIRRNAPEAAGKALVPGDDHLPLEDFAKDPNGPFVTDSKNLPYGENFMFVGKSKDHRALINYTPNLRILAFDLAVIRRESI